jgi:hypothetical protein
MTNKQSSGPIAHNPTTVVEISAAQREIAELDRELCAEAQRLYEVSRKSGAPAAPISEHDRRVGKHLQKYLNGSTPARLLGDSNISRDAEIRAHREALQIVSRELMKRKEAAVYADAEKWVAANDEDWRSLCHEIVLTAAKLAALEEGARRFLEPIAQVLGLNFAMAGTIGSGLSLLGTGDPLKEMREAALKDNIVTEGELRKAQKL